MKKIIILANNSSGLYDFRNELISELIKQDNRVIIYTPFDLKVDDLKNLGTTVREISIDRRGINPFSDFTLFRTYQTILKKEKPDLVITYTIKPNVYGGFACRLANIPYAINITGLGTAFENGGVLRNVVIVLYKTACKKAKVVFFENDENRRLFVKEKIVTEQQTHRLNGAGVNIEKFCVSEYPNKDKIKFLFMGRVMAEKGIDELFAAMQMLIADGIDCELDVLGRYEENYKNKIDSYVAAGWLHYYGYQSDVRPFIEKCHCFVLPSWHEGMANTNLECAASGRPVITSDIPGCMEAVEDGVSGFLVERKNVDDLYRTMKKFTELSYEERKAMGLAGRKHMEEIFDKRKVVDETLKELMK